MRHALEPPRRVRCLAEHIEAAFIGSGFGAPPKPSLNLTQIGGLGLLGTAHEHQERAPTESQPRRVPVNTQQPCPQRFLLPPVGLGCARE